MKQYSKLFQRSYLGDDSTDTKLNKFLKEHPNYTVDKISFENPKGTCRENLFVVFNIDEEQSNKSDKFNHTIDCLKQGKLPPLNMNSEDTEGLYIHKYGWT